MPGLLCFVIDGLHTETLASVRTPHLDRLGRRGASCRRLLAPPPALTLPALTTLFTSLPPEEHGVQGTSATGAVSPQAVNLLALLRYRQLRAAAFYQSDRLRPIFPPGCLHTGVLQSAEDIGNVDRDLGETAARHLQRDQPDFCLIVLQGPDIAAVHFGADSEPYRESVEQADQVLGLLLESLNFVGMGEEYTVLALGCPGHRPLPAGGVAMLKAWQGPFGEVLFCPTGGIHVGNAPEFLALPNVACVGGSWIVPTDAIVAGDWARITQLAREATQLSR